MKTILMLLIAAMAIVSGSVISQKDSEIRQLKFSLQQISDDLRSIRQLVSNEEKRKEQVRRDSLAAAVALQQSLERYQLPTIVPVQ